MEKGYPLMIVFYLDREMMMNPDVIQPFAESVNDALAQREANAMAFFIPTDGEERIECINPMQVEETEMGRINGIVQDLVKSFDIGQGADEGKNDSSAEVNPDKPDEHGEGFYKD
jgi:hypothetical protein